MTPTQQKWLGHFTASLTLWLFSILSHIFTPFNHLCAFLCRFYAIYCVVILHQLPAVFILHFCDFSVAYYQQFLQRDGQFCVFVCVRHSAHCFLLLESCMLYVVKKHCPDEAHLNRWAKRRLIRKIARRANLSAWYFTLVWRQEWADDQLSALWRNTRKTHTSYKSNLCISQSSPKPNFLIIHTACTWNATVA